MINGYIDLALLAGFVFAEEIGGGVLHGLSATPLVNRQAGRWGD